MGSYFPLFVLARCWSSVLFIKTCNWRGDMDGTKIAPTPPRVNHLLFADDWILFCKASAPEVFKMKEVEKYCNASGQWINNEKSSIFFGKGCPEVVRNNVKNILDFHNETLNDKYLGVPSDVGRSKNGILAIWKIEYGSVSRIGWRKFC